MCLRRLHVCALQATFGGQRAQKEAAHTTSSSFNLRHLSNLNRLYVSCYGSSTPLLIPS